ncbi:hypothetical protein CHS0354_013201, partial [Potamilus streckersoni]
MTQCFVVVDAGPLASIMTNKYGCRVTTIVGAIVATAGLILSIFAPNLYFLYFSFGVLPGIGFGLIYLPAIVSIGYYFEGKRAFATGLAVCGSGLGGFIFNPLTEFLIDSYDWRGTTLILGGIILNCVLCGAMFRPLESRARVYQSASIPISNPALSLDTVEICGCITLSDRLCPTLKQIFDFSLLKDVVFLMFGITSFFTNLGYYSPFIYLPDRAIDDGISEDEAKWLVSALGISTTVVKVLFGFVSNKPRVNKLMIYSSAVLMCGVSTALSPLCFNYKLLILYSCVFGLFVGAYDLLTSLVLVDLLGIEMLTESFGLYLMIQGIAILIGPPIA